MEVVATGHLGTTHAWPSRPRCRAGGAVKAPMMAITAGTAAAPSPDARGAAQLHRESRGSEHTIAWKIRVASG